MDFSENEIKAIVKEKYGKVAQDTSCGESCCCGGSPGLAHIGEIGRKLGYSAEDLAFGKGDANMGLGCGNPLSVAGIRAGEKIVDLGCGAGFDAFLAAKKVGPEGRVVGVDMTPEMIEKARANAEKFAVSNVEFRLGEIERLPIPDNWADLVISNCVINLSPSKEAVFDEIFRVLGPGGRICTLTNDQFPEMRFDYLLANPPFGVDWKGEKKEIGRWPNFRGYNGKLPRVNDGALFF